MTLFVDHPEPGFYKIKKVKNGIWVPVKIWRPCLCTIGGQDEEHEWTKDCDRYPGLWALLDGWKEVDPLEIWSSCIPIEASEYNYMVDLDAWARSHDPESPEANPNQRVNLRRLPPVF